MNRNEVSAHKLIIVGIDAFAQGDNLKLQKFFFSVALFLLLGNRAFSAIAIGFGGSSESNYYGVTKVSSNSYNLSLTVDLISSVRLGYEFAQGTVVQDTYVDLPVSEASEETVQVAYKRTKNYTSHAGNLILVLYSGTYFQPYIFGGAVRSAVTIKDEVGPGGAYGVREDSDPVKVEANYGIGVAIMFSRNFKLKFSNKWQDTEYEVVQADGSANKTEKVRDSKLVVSATYTIPY